MAEENVVQVVLRAVDQMSADLKRAEAELGRLKSQGEQASVSTERLSRSTNSLRVALGPARAATSQLTTALALMHPQLGAIILSLDNLVFAIANATRGAATLGAAILAGLKAGLIVGLILAVIAVVTQLVRKWMELREAQEKQLKTSEELEVAMARANATSAMGAIIAEKNVRLRQLESTEMDATVRAFRKREVAERASTEQDILAITTRRQALDPLRESVELMQGEIEARRAMLGDMIQGNKIVQTTVDLERVMATVKKSLGDVTSETAKRIRDLATSFLLEKNALEENLSVLKLFEEERKKQFDREVLQEAARGDEDNMREELERWPRVVGEAIFERNESIRKAAESMADQFSSTLTDRLVMFLSGSEQFSLQEIAAGIGKSIVTMMIQAMLKELLIVTFAGILKQWMASSGKPAGEFSFGGGLLQLLGGIGKIFGFAHGGMVIPQGALQEFQHGGIVQRSRGRGVIGELAEEGPEIVARMRPMRPSNEGGGQVVQNIYLVDQRPPRLGPNDVVMIVAGDTARGGKTAQATRNILRTHA